MYNKWAAHSTADTPEYQPNFCQTSHCYPWPTGLMILSSNISVWFLLYSSLENGYFFPLFPIRKNRLAVGIINSTKETAAWASLTKALITVFLLITCLSVTNSIPVYTWSVWSNTKQRLTENTNQPIPNQHHINILMPYFYNCLLLLFKRA